MAHPQEIVIEADRPLSHYWRDVWAYRELFAFLAWRDVLVLYKQTALGVAWAVLRPFLTVAIFTVVFGKIAKIPTGDIPVAALILAGTLPWQFFATAFTESSNSLINSTALVSKVYFPRLIVPAVGPLVALVDFVIGSVLGVGVLAYFGIMPTWRYLAIPGLVLLVLLTSFGLGLWIAALNVRYRDFRYAVPFFVQIGYFISPVPYASSLVPEHWRMLYSLNPMVGVIDAFRWALLGTPLDPRSFAVSMIVMLVVLFGGFSYFRRFERKFADVI